MLTRENEGSKKSVRKVVHDFVHQQYLLCFSSMSDWAGIYFIAAGGFMN